MRQGFVAVALDAIAGAATAARPAAAVIHA
jgi:hypothetical protein